MDTVTEQGEILQTMLENVELHTAQRHYLRAADALRKAQLPNAAVRAPAQA